jgi:predicted porin
MFWDDGGEQNVYSVDNYNESSRTGLKGNAKISDDWSAGYRLEWEYRMAASSRVNQFEDDNANDPSMVVRWSQMYLASKTYGTLNWGLTATPKYDITKNAMEYISTVKGEGGGLSDTLVSDFRMNPNFRLRPTGFDNAEGLSSLTWSNIARCYGASDQFNCSTRRNGVNYSTPDWQGFNVQWGWFEDDDWGAALRYKNTFTTTPGNSPPTSPTRISVTSACKLAAAARRPDRSSFLRPHPRRHSSGASSTSGQGRSRSSTRRADSSP